MKVIFLDRDGVINEFPGNGNYVTKVKDFHFIPGARRAIRLLTEAGFKIFVISNQAGVGKGIYSWNKLSRITIKMFNGVIDSGGRIDKVYYAISRGGEGCEFRKPGIGFIREAFKSMGKTLRAARSSYFVGDTESDIEAGYNAGCKTIFVLSGREDRRYMRKWKVRPDYIAKDLLEAARLMIQWESPEDSASRQGRKKKGTARASSTRNRRSRRSVSERSSTRRISSR